MISPLLGRSRPLEVKEKISLTKRFCSICVDLYKRAKSCIIRHMREVYISLFLGFLGFFGYLLPITLDKWEKNSSTKSLAPLGILCVISVVIVVFCIFQSIKYGKIHDYSLEHPPTSKLSKKTIYQRVVAWLYKKSE